MACFMCMALDGCSSILSMPPLDSSPKTEQSITSFSRGFWIWLLRERVGERMVLRGEERGPKVLEDDWDHHC